MNKKSLRDLIQKHGKITHEGYLHRPFCPYETSCLKNLLEGNYDELFTNPELAKITTEAYCTIFSRMPVGCPYNLKNFKKPVKLRVSINLS